MTYGRGEVLDIKRRKSVLRTCPHCGIKIRWLDYSGLATQAWHFDDSIITQAVVSTTAQEEIDSPDMPAFQKCGHCDGDVSAMQMR